MRSKTATGCPEYVRTSVSMLVAAMSGHRVSFSSAMGFAPKVESVPAFRAGRCRRYDRTPGSANPGTGAMGMVSRCRPREKVPIADHPAQRTMPPPSPPATTVPPRRRNSATCVISPDSRPCSGSASMRMAGRTALSVTRSKRLIRRRATGRPIRAITSYTPFAPLGPVRKVDAFSSSDAGVLARDPAATAVPTAAASRAASPTSDLSDMAHHRTGRLVELGVPRRVARLGAEEMPVEIAHQSRQGRAAVGVEPRLGHVFGGSLRVFRLDDLPRIQIVYQRHEAPGERVGEAAFPGQRLG